METETTTYALPCADSQPRPGSRRAGAALLTLLCLLLYLPGIISLPPFDRDEARYAQASKQMLESGDYTRIFFQDMPRHKKPVGIYWLQAASASLFDSSSSRHIFFFRLPSVLAAIASVLLFYCLCLRFYESSVAFAASAMLASTTTLVAEAHLATTDAALLLCSVACLMPLTLAWHERPKRQGWLHFFLMWAGLGAGILIKGPVLPGVFVLCVVSLGWCARSLRWITALRPIAGIFLAALIALPWFLIIDSQTGGSFLHDSFSGDILPKFAGVQESHGGFPGYYLLSSVISFWPWSFLLAPAALLAWTRRKEPPTAALLCWLIPSWLLLEFVPTKLPHYTLPLFPPLTLLCSMALMGPRQFLQNWPARVSLVLWTLAGLLLALAIPGMPWYFDGEASLAKVAMLLIAATLLSVFVKSWIRDPSCIGASLALLAGLWVFTGVFGWMLPGLKAFWASERLHETVLKADPLRKAQIVAAGFSEPSFVFLAGTTTRLAEGKVAAEVFKDACPAVALVSAREKQAFESEMPGVQAAPLSDRVFNYSRGKWLEIFHYVKFECPEK